MPARKRPTSEDAGIARRVLLDGLARDADVVELVSELAPLHPRDNTFPGEVFLRAAADALDWCGASRAEPLSLEGLRERFLPERVFRGRQNSKFQYAVLAAAALQGGTEPDLLEEVAWWQADDFWQYALFAAVAYIRAAASRVGVPGPGSAPWPSTAVTTSRDTVGTQPNRSSHDGRPIITADLARQPHHPTHRIGTPRVTVLCASNGPEGSSQYRPDHALAQGLTYGLPQHGP